MQTLKIEQTKYVLIAQKELEKLQELVARKEVLQKKMSLSEGRKLAYKMIDKWAKGQ